MRLKTSTTYLDLIILIFFTGIMSFIAINLDVFEYIYEFSRNYEEFNMDEIIIILSISSIVLFIFAIRRILESKRDLKIKLNFEEEKNDLFLFLEMTFNLLPAIFIAVDKDYRVFLWNNKAQEYSGISLKEAKAELVWDLLPLVQKFKQELHHSFIKKEILRIEKINCREHDKENTYNLRFFPIITQNIQGVVIQIQNITSYLELQKQNIQNEKMSSIGRLAAGFAHEINNPLSGIIQGTQNIQRRLSVDFPKNLQIANDLGISLDLLHSYLKERDIFYFLQGIIDTSLRAANIIKDMLQFSRPSNDKTLYLDIHHSIEKALKFVVYDFSFEEKYDFKKIEIIRDFQSDLPKIPIIETEIEQVFLNLFKNAGQELFNSQIKNPKITIQTRQLHNNIFMYVEDNGNGMSETVQNKAFEPFFTTKEIGMGTGLGLSIVYSIITNNHNGTIEIDSTLGKGTKIVINLPVS